MLPNCSVMARKALMPRVALVASCSPASIQKVIQATKMDMYVGTYA